MTNRIILHVDLDAFFAALEQREHPGLRGKPVVVGADPKKGKGRGVVSTCSYEARKYGIRSGMPISIAWRKCPTATFLPVNWPLIEKASESIMTILRSHADRFEQGGIDEAYLDVSERTKSFDAAENLARKIKDEIKSREKLTCSIGIGPNKLIAKIASDFKKPDGLTVVRPAEVRKFLRNMDVDKLLGVGPKTTARLKEINIATIGQLSNMPKFALVEHFGKSFGTYLFGASKGIDEEPVEETEEIKSISREHTFEKDTRDAKLLHKTLEELAKDVISTLKNENLLYKTVTLRIRFTGFETHTRQKSIKQYSKELGPALEIANSLLGSFLKEKEKPVRLIGFRLSGLKEKK